AASQREKAVFAFFDLLEALYVLISGTVPHAVFIEMQRVISSDRAPREIARIREFPSRFNELWNDAVTTLSALQIDMRNAGSLIRKTRANRKRAKRRDADRIRCVYKGSFHYVMFAGNLFFVGVTLFVLCCL